MISVPNLQLKAIFLLHLLLSLWPLQERWAPQAYLYYNLVYLLTLAWAIHNKDSEEPVFMALAINLGSIIMDIITLAMSFPSTFTFCAGMAIVLLLFRPISSILLLRIFNERGGRYADLGIPNFGGAVGGGGLGGRGQYDDIDQTTTQSVPKTGLDTGSPGHGYSSGDGLPPSYGAPPYSQP
ncbi:conserved hypothetical protein [Ixodes scapularis]|uniref:Angiotensin ii n=1 Tax=Ixodes scapularis TaxID=6945 RepID=B7PLX4_IXOSC|nr:conserved hypothetical protein [Ixodes scapularis]|eukprot:XP_002434772.1 conserved hypothetical protein [Ixodes scapularis]